MTEEPTPQAEPDRPPDPPPLTPPVPGPVQEITRPQELAELAARLARASRIAMDTEANSLHAYTERTCIVQISAGAEHAIIDALEVTDLSALKAALDRPDVELIFHGGDYDITVLTRDHDFRFDRVFDTMIAASLLGLERVGLADLVDQHFGVTLDKTFQRADWARRPLSQDHRDYLHRDTLYLQPLAEHLRERLEQADLVEEAGIEFSRLARRQGKPASPDADAWRRAKGAQHLDARARAALAALWAWREEEAAARDRPPFKVIGPRELVALAKDTVKIPNSPGDLCALPPALRRRYGSAVLRALRKGEMESERGNAPPADVRPQRSAQERETERARRQLEDAFKQWRRTEAQQREVPTVVVLPNSALAWLIDERPTDRSQILTCADIGPKRTERYAEAYLQLLQAAPA